MKRLSLLAAAVALLFAVTACDRGYPTESSQFATGSTPSLQSVSAADAGFVQQMVARQQEAAAMASVALDPARRASPRVQQLAQEISAGGDQQVAQMSQWLRQWQVPSPPPAATPATQQFASLTSGKFDKAWLAAMVANRQQGVAAAVEAQKASDTQQVRDLAAEVVRTQDAQISAMQALQ